MTTGAERGAVDSTAGEAEAVHQCPRVAHPRGDATRATPAGPPLVEGCSAPAEPRGVARKAAARRGQAALMARTRAGALAVEMEEPTRQAETGLGEAAAAGETAAAAGETAAAAGEAAKEARSRMPFLVTGPRMDTTRQSSKTADLGRCKTVEARSILEAACRRRSSQLLAA